MEYPGGRTEPGAAGEGRVSSPPKGFAQKSPAPVTKTFHRRPGKKGPDFRQLQQFFPNLGDVQPEGPVGGKGSPQRGGGTAGVRPQWVPAVLGNAEAGATVQSDGGFLRCQEGFCQFFPWRAPRITEETDRPRSSQQAWARSPRVHAGPFRTQMSPGLPLGQGQKDQVYGFVHGHEEPGHGGLCQGERAAGGDLLQKQRDDAAPCAHDIATPGAGDPGTTRPQGGGFGKSGFFHEGLGSSHGVDGIGGLVSGEADQGLHPGGCGGLQHMFCAQYVGSTASRGKKIHRRVPA